MFSLHQSPYKRGNHVLLNRGHYTAAQGDEENQQHLPWGNWGRSPHYFVEENKIKRAVAETGNKEEEDECWKNESENVFFIYLTDCFTCAFISKFMESNSSYQLTVVTN